VLWQAHAGALWARFTTTLRRTLATQLGLRARDFAEYARLSYAKVAEYQRRGLVHFHAVLRIDGPDGPTDPPPAGLDLPAFQTAITSAARATSLTPSSGRMGRRSCWAGGFSSTSGRSSRPRAGRSKTTRGDH
jgi:hypothetical protein